MNYPFLMTGKVVAIHRESHAVDIVLMDGNRINDVSVLGVGGSNFGVAGLVAPDADKEHPNRKTYSADTAKRDLYAVVASAAGSSHGSSGMFVLGFLYPEVSEMLFAGDKYPNLMIYRHPSDVQVTVDADGKTSIQHPAGARITIGTDFGPVGLEGKDFDELYRLRKNLGIKVGIRIKDTAESTITLDHEGNIDIKAPIDITEDAGRDITATAGRDINETAERDIAMEAKTRDITAKALRDVTVTATTRDIKAKALRDVTVEATERDVTVQAGRDLTADVARDVNVQAGGKIDVLAVGDIGVVGGAEINVEAAEGIAVTAGATIKSIAGSAQILTSGVVISLQAPFIFLN